MDGQSIENMRCFLNYFSKPSTQFRSGTYVKQSLSSMAVNRGITFQRFFTNENILCETYLWKERPGCCGTSVDL